MLGHYIIEKVEDKILSNGQIYKKKRGVWNFGGNVAPNFVDHILTNLFHFIKKVMK